MPRADDVWIPLVDEPIGSLVTEIEATDSSLSALVRSPRRRLAFYTFAYVRVGVLLGRLLVEQDVREGEDGSWVESLLRDPKNRDRVAAEVRAVAEEVARDPKYADDDTVPDEEMRERFRAFARQHRETT